MELSEKLQNKLDSLTKPQGSLGELEKTALKLGLIQNRVDPVIDNKSTIVFAGDHGVVKHGVSAFPKEVTVQMVLNFLNNGAAINVLSKYVNSKVFVVDAGVDFDFDDNCGVIKNKILNGTGDLYKDKAMTVDEAKKNIELGKEITKKIISENKIDMIALGEMGIGNTTPATILISKICGLDYDSATGRGTGINDEGLNIKKKIIDEVLSNIKEVTEPYELLSCAGGLEIAQITGAVLACQELNVPAVIDGLICTSGALIASLINGDTKKIMFAGHKSHEPSHIYALQKLGLKPLLDLDMRLGEGTGAVLAMNIIEASTKIINEMATFESAGVSNKDE